MNRYSTMILAATIAGAGLLQAQDNPLSGGIKFVYGIAKGDIIKSAEKMPESNYSFKPSPDVRSFGQILGHVADAEYAFCGAVAGESKQMNIEKTKTSKEELTAAVRDAFAYCDGVYNSLTDATAADMIKFFGQSSTKLGVLAFNNAHTFEHYGNLVTYMRIKGIVPPSSEPPPAKKSSN